MGEMFDTGTACPDAIGIGAAASETVLGAGDGAAAALFAHGVPYRFHHLGVRVPSDRAARRVMRDLGLTAAWVNDLDDHACRCHFCPGPGLAIELVVPLSEASSTNAIPHALHHVGIEVPRMLDAQRVLGESGYELTGERPLMIVDRYLVNFVRPLRLGFLLELVEDRESSWAW
ncbi:VOC family protein [Streptosporangium sp. NPDC051023]|uniref:VOC family protein n=1 Tax=Streptosporangium sp. NPDC051023 TaxID=3155410 RepID=UPI00344BA75D